MMHQVEYPALWGAEDEKRLQKAAENRDGQETVPQPEERRCVRCVMTNRRPRISFDKDGLCSACQHHDRKASEIDWRERYHELQRVLDRQRFDWPYGNVVVPASGGKDSAFVAGTLRDEFHMNPICARWAPHMITEVGERNWHSFLHHGFNGITAQPDGLLHRRLSRISLEFFGDPFIPFIWGQLAWPMHVARLMNIRLVFFGENGEAEYGGDTSANDRPRWNTDDWDRVYMKNANPSSIIGIGRELGLLTVEDERKASAFYYVPGGAMDEMEFHWLGYYLPWRPQENYYYACSRTGFEANDTRSEGTYSRYASLDDKLDGLHYWFGYLKFGIGRCTSDAAHEVRDGELTRDEALKLIERYDSERPVRHLDECLRYLGMTREHLLTVERRFASVQPPEAWWDG